jgi:putative methyltransferase (TIGR04325 family)
MSPLAALRQRLRRFSERVDSVHGHTTATRLELAEHREQMAARLDGIEAEQRRALDALRPINDRDPLQRERLRELRRQPAYERAFSGDRPLVSIVIPTYGNYEMLRERALPSALNQTYDQIEVIVVGDESPPQTSEAVASLGDDRVRYFNRPLRGPYPDDPKQRWYVAGSSPYNDAVALASGEWIAPLDDDDAFTPDHVERLLEFARAERAELAYGAIRQHRPGGVVDRIGSFPPQWAEFNLQAAIYHAGLATIFDLELADWIYEEPYDWSLVRRMLRAGVRCAFLDEELVEYYPSRYWVPGEPTAVPGPTVEPGVAPPEWEFATDGWGETSEDADGWDVGAVAAAYREKWPQFLSAIEGPGPLGVAHETPTGVTVGREDPIAHNIVYSFAHALGQAARGRERISVLDWGGAVGHYHELAKRLCDVELDYHCRELPAVCAIGRELSPEITFHETDECLERGYDLVLVSASFQYARDWRSLLGRLARSARPYMLLTRMPVVESHPGYVALQRAYGYGYETEYRGWVLHRGELVLAALDEGLELVREYALVAPIQVVGAPENPKHIGLLLRARGDGEAT